MADTFSNDLRLRLQESGANSGQWGSLLNDTITNIASAFSLGSEAIPDASTHTITLADDSSSGDEARSLFLKCTGGGQACTVTLAPNTVSKVWIISNETSFTLTFSAGSGANVAVAAGSVKVIVTDGAGSGAAVVDALSGLAITGSTATFTTSDNSTQLTVKSTDGDANAGPVFDLVRDSGSPADNDVLGRIRFRADNDAGEETTMVYMQTNLLDASDGTEDAGLDLFSKVSGTLRRRISINSTESVFNEDSRNLDFRVESDSNTHALFVEGSTSNIGITGQTSPTFNLDGGFVTQTWGWHLNTSYQAGFTYTTTDRSLSIFTKSADNADYIKFSTGGSATERGRITAAGDFGLGTASPGAALDINRATGTASYARVGNGGNVQAYIGVAGDNLPVLGSFTNHALRMVVNASEVARFDTSGNLLAGTTNANPAANNVTGHALKAGGLAEHSNSGAVVMRLNRTDSDGDILQFYKGTGTVGVIQTKSSQLSIGTGDTGIQTNQDVNAIIPHNITTNANVDNSIDLGYAAGGTNFRFKDIYLSGGAYLGGTGSANYLDDVETGTWTPTLATGTVANKSGNYTKIGRLVHVTGFFSALSDRSSTNGLQISNLPFAIGVTNRAYPSGIFGQYIDQSPDTAYASGSTTFSVYSAKATGAYEFVQHNDFNNTASALYFSITYYA